MSELSTPTFYISICKNAYTFCLDSNALQCYQCGGEGTNCNGERVICEEGSNRCAKLNYGIAGVNYVMKGCETAYHCSDNQASQLCYDAQEESLDLVKCKELNCCSGDNCNRSSKNFQVMFGIIVFGVLAAIMLK